ncbi:hypothetical protein EO92_18315 [Methanosarcina sp. 2.H.A.1B.4]|nr:hypothetical protein EO92_18315 [Methanosarcina sp. 2.H.A.1B.4]
MNFSFLILTLYFSSQRKEGQIIFHAVSKDVPPDIPVDEMNLIPIKITIYGPDDCAVKDKQELLDKRIKRISSETYAQGALITQADIAILLEESTRTISQHITSLEKKGELVPTRGKMEVHRSWDKPHEKKLWSFTSKVMNILRSKERQNIVAKPSCAMGRTLKEYW